jgi:hypothetical protein
MKKGDWFYLKKNGDHFCIRYASRENLYVAKKGSNELANVDVDTHISEAERIERERKKMLALSKSKEEKGIEKFLDSLKNTDFDCEAVDISDGNIFSSIIAQMRYPTNTQGGETRIECSLEEYNFAWRVRINNFCWYSLHKPKADKVQKNEEEHERPGRTSGPENESGSPGYNRTGYD